jgi:hypothetical protein
MSEYLKFDKISDNILKDVQYKKDIVKEYDLAVIQQINIVLDFYKEEVEGLERIFADENNFSDNLLMQIDSNISLKYIENLSYESIVKKCILELEFILDLGFTAYSRTIFQILSDLIQRFKDIKNNIIKEGK